jgi:hypothetical protein
MPAKFGRIVGNQYQGFELREIQAGLRAAVAVVEDASKIGAIFFDGRQHGFGVPKHMGVLSPGPLGDLDRRHGEAGDGRGCGNHRKRRGDGGLRLEFEI